jgi:hypothetical protein
MKQFILYCTFYALAICNSFAQNTADSHLLYNVQSQIIPVDYPSYLLLQNYHSYAYWSTHIQNKSLQRQLLKQVDAKYLLIQPTDNTEAANTGTWDASIARKPICITTQQQDSIQNIYTSVPVKWYWSKARYFKALQKAQLQLLQSKQALPIYETQVFTIHEPWIVNKGSVCIMYVQSKNLTTPTQEKIIIFDRIDYTWKKRIVLE